MMMDKLFLVLVAVVASVALGCLESNPQPSPLGDDTGGGQGEPTVTKSPVVDEGKIFMSAPDEAEMVVIAADDGAAMGASGAYASAEGADPEADGDNAREEEKGDEFGVDDDGSFVIVLSGVKPPKVFLTFEFPDFDDIVVELEVPTATADEDDDAVWLAPAGEEGREDPGANSELPADYDGFKDMSGGAITGVAVVDTGEGEVEVVGSFLSVTPFSVVVVVNLSSEEKSIVNANNQGEFIAPISANSEDVLSLFASNPGDHGKATAPVYLTVE
jgi:hypothetical protein